MNAFENSFSGHSDLQLIQNPKLYTEYFDKQYKESGDFTKSMKDVVSGALASPRFIMVHNKASDASPNHASFNLATRLSFFLWSSIPDDELLVLAGKGNFKIQRS